MYSLLIFLFTFLPGFNHQVKDLQFDFIIPDSLKSGIEDGRLFLLLADNNKTEPRFQISDGVESQLIFGKDIIHWTSGLKQTMGGSILGYPIESLKDIPPGVYYVQGLCHVYETLHLKSGQVVKLPLDRGEGQHWNLAPGNLYSKPIKIEIKSAGIQRHKIFLNQKITPIIPAQDTKYIKHVKIQSKLLTEFWGRPMYLAAHILLPEGFETHPGVRYPLAVYHGHFPDDISGFRTELPDPNLAPDSSARFRLKGYNRIQQQEAFDFYKIWTGPDFPRVIAIEIQHPSPYYDDSYAVNSASQGPWGDAITYELIPSIEKSFRGIGKGWSRFTYGGSTGGWEALAVQIFYPDEYNGTYAACPDPIDFRAYCLINIYEDENAFYYNGPFNKLARPGLRNYLGQISTTVQAMNHKELVLGTHSRSGEQYDIWEATFSPIGKDGYPQRIFDKKSGDIDKNVAAYWKENFDLSYIMKRDWKKNGNKWKGRIHLYCGDMDNFYLNNAVYLAEDFLKSTTDPYYDGEVDYGDRAEHCWNGDHMQPNAISRLRYHRYFIPKWAEEVKKTAPVGSDLTSWRY